jgi:hypothetical protein
VALQQVKLAIVAENIGKLGLAVAIICFVAQIIIWLAEMGKEVKIIFVFYLFAFCILCGSIPETDMIFVSPIVIRRLASRCRIVALGWRPVL